MSHHDCICAIPAKRPEEHPADCPVRRRHDAPRPTLEPIRLTIDHRPVGDGPLVIEISRVDATVVLRAVGGEERTLRGARAVLVAQKVFDLARTCEVAHAEGG